jgi:response regulator RpfG family c-di-GMP phosphodiesterase
MARSLGLSPEDRQNLEVSAWLHDIGLVGVPREVIRRWEQEPESLDVAERALIEQHPILGQELVQFVHHLETVGTIIRAHHERFDGTGYPDRLTGENIPWLSRLLAVVVKYAEKKDSSADSQTMVELASGSAFDPEAVRAFVQVLPMAIRPRRMREVLLSELRPGMVLAQNVYTANGLLLIPEGRELSAPAIEKVLNHDRIQPITQALTVYC